MNPADLYLNGNGERQFKRQYVLHIYLISVAVGLGFACCASRVMLQPDVAEVSSCFSGLQQECCCRVTATCRRTACFIPAAYYPVALLFVCAVLPLNADAVNC